MAEEFQYQWTDNPTVSGVAKCNTDILNDCLMHLKYDKKDGGLGFNLFDTKVSDYILEGDETLGWALQGTYVYKNAIAGSHYGYPDFYAKCLEEYQDSSLYIESWTQPKATANTTSIEGGSMVITASSESGTNWAAYKAFDSTSSSVGNGWATDGTNISGWWQVKFPYKIRIKGLKYHRRYSENVDNATSGRFYTSSAKTVALGDTFSVAAGTLSEFSVDINNIPSSGVITDTIYLETSAVSGSYGGMDYLEIDAERVVVSEFVYKNSNGHLFYDIANKSSIDKIFNSMGSAWFYGIDTENERIFLPRNNWFEQATGDTSEVGQSIEAGLPNIKGTFTFDVNTSEYYSGGWTGAFSKTEAGSQGSSGDGVTSAKATFDASKSNSIYGNSGTVQPKAVKKLLYICVGNTVTDTSWVDVVTQVDGGVKDLEDKTNEGLEALSNASNALRQTQISNCILEIPQRIKLELADGVLTLKAGSTVIVPNGANNFEHKSSTSDLSRSTFGTQSGENIYIELVVDSSTLVPAGLSWSTKSNTTVGTTAPTSGIFYDTANNEIYNYNSSGKLDRRSFPVALVTMENGTVTKIEQVFNGIGYIGSTIFVDKGVKVLLPNGKNDDGSLNNIETTTSKVLIDNSFNNDYNLVQARIELYNGSLRVIRNTVSDSSGFDYENNIYYRNDGQHKNSTLLATTKTSSTGIEDFKPEYAFKALGFSDKPEISGWGMPSRRYKNLTLGTSKSTYTAPANGWFCISTKTETGKYFCLANITSFIRTQVYSTGVGEWVETYIPVAKGQTVETNYNTTNTTCNFIFVYAEGEI